jgi:hypothetical protein
MLDLDEFLQGAQAVAAGGFRTKLVVKQNRDTGDGHPAPRSLLERPVDFREHAKEPTPNQRPEMRPFHGELTQCKWVAHPKHFRLTCCLTCARPNCQANSGFLKLPLNKVQKLRTIFDSD